MTDATLEWLEQQRAAGAQLCTCGCGRLLPMGDPAELPWCAEHGALDWRPNGFRLLLADGTDVTDDGPPFEPFVGGCLGPFIRPALA